jgi:nitrate/TMAO reductase-like tetraheme cytochrome c subunit
MTEEVRPSSEPTPPPAPGAPEAAPPRRPRRWPIWLAVLVGVIFLFIFFIGSSELLDYTESTEFCTLCHVMSPEATAYHNSPHAKTDCGTCHIGPGVIHAVQAKLANVRYLWVYPTNSYERPIPSPITSLRPAEEVCEQCHWPQKVYGDRIAVLPDYGVEASNPLTQTALAMQTGGGSSSQGLGRGIHWHIENPVYYIATDEKRQDIPWVQATFNGVTTEYLSTDSNLTPEALAKYEKRKMDCIDCHNRASHNFRKPSEVLDEAMAAGQIPADLPEIKAQGVAVLDKQYATEAEAAAAIAAVEDYYKTNLPDVYAQREADVKTAVAGLQDIFDRTQFPFMNVTWESHPNNIGHKDFPGCMRCHDGKHLSADNQAIRLECNICHTIPQVAGPGQPVPPVAAAPATNEPESHRSTTWLAEHRFRFDNTCAECHTTDNPGGSDNSSFCSNSACHATEWQFAGLNAPKILELSKPPATTSQGTANAVPHPISARTNCLLCHAPDKVRPYPANHTSFTTEMCTQCHAATLEEAAPAGAGEQAPGGPPAIPHPLEGRADCKQCHGPDGVKPFPANHKDFPVDSCTTCHKPATGETPAAATPTAEATATAAATAAATTESATAGQAPGSQAPAIPHELAGRDNCTACHDPETGFKPAPANHKGRANTTCQGCHQPAATGNATPAAGATPSATAAATAEAAEGETAGQPPAIPHSLAGRDNCLICHDPQTGVKPAPADHQGRTVGTCQTCHKPAVSGGATPSGSATPEPAPTVEE